MASPPPFLPYGRQVVDERDIEAVTAALRQPLLTGGPAVAAFEEALAAACGARQAVACANGTAALHLAAMAAGLGNGDAAVVPTMTFLATANCVRYVGAEVVFADVDRDSGLLTPATLEAALARQSAGGGPPPKAVLPVHLAGQSCDMDGIAQVALRHGLVVIEDACHALGTRGSAPGATDDPVGSCRASAMTVFSFHPVKTITTGEGGAVTTGEGALAARLRLLRGHGMTRDPADFRDAVQAFGPDGAPNPWYYEMHEPGFNYRLDDIACALGLSQLAKLEGFAATRRDLVARYDAALAALAPAVRPLGRMDWCRPVWHLYVALIDFAGAGIRRPELMRRLQAAGIGTQVHYLPVHRQPYYRRRYGALSLPGADAYYERCLSLPLHAAMVPTDVDRVVGALADALAPSA